VRLRGLLLFCRPYWKLDATNSSVSLVFIMPPMAWRSY